MSPVTSVRVLAFAAARELVGGGEVAVPLEAACTAGDLWPRLCERFPALAPHRASIRLAVNGVWAVDEDPVAPGDEVALLPPVAGG